MSYIGARLYDHLHGCVHGVWSSDTAWRRLRMDRIGITPENGKWQRCQGGLPHVGKRLTQDTMPMNINLGVTELVKEPNS